MACDECKRLTAEIERLTREKQISEAAFQGVMQDNKDLAAEITRLGLALEDTLPELVNIATSEWVEPLRVSDMEKVKQIIRNVIARVREALRGKP